MNSPANKSSMTKGCAPPFNASKSTTPFFSKCGAAEKWAAASRGYPRLLGNPQNSWAANSADAAAASVHRSTTPPRPQTVAVARRSRQQTVGINIARPANRDLRHSIRRGSEASEKIRQSRRETRSIKDPDLLLRTSPTLGKTWRASFARQLHESMKSKWLPARLMSLKWNQRNRLVLVLEDPNGQTGRRRRRRRFPQRPHRLPPSRWHLYLNTTLCREPEAACDS